MSEDPIDFEAGDPNLYRYVSNAPMNAIDPDGLQEGRPVTSAELNDLITNHPQAVKDAIQAANQKRAKAEQYKRAMSGEYGEIRALPGSAQDQINKTEQFYRELNQRTDLSSFEKLCLPFFLPAQVNPSPFNLDNTVIMFGGLAPGAFGGPRSSDAQISGASSKVATATTKQLQKKFKHAADFGVTGTPTKANLGKFYESIQSHLNDPAVKEIRGAYRGDPALINVDLTTGLAVIRNTKGSFLSGWKLSPQQLEHVLTSGKLGGG